jgi:hypothetical protein
MLLEGLNTNFALPGGLVHNTSVNIHIYDASNSDTMLRGLYIKDGVTNANLYSMVKVNIS